MFFKVVAKCGHVGRYNYIIKSFFVKAKTAKEAAFKIRNAPRVKHHHKDAIRSVEEINYEEYVKGVIEMEEDKYFHIHNSSDQKRLQIEGVIREDENFMQNMYDKKENIRYKIKKEKLKEIEYEKIIREAYYG